MAIQPISPIAISLLLLRLDEAVLFTEQVRVTYSGSSIDDSTQSHNLETFSNFTTRNSSRVFTLESLSSTKSVIYEDLGFDGTPTTAQITSLASEATHSAGSFVIGKLHNPHCRGY